MVVALTVLLVASSAAAAGGAAAWDASYDGRILPGVRAGTVDLSGMTREQARAALAAAYPLDQGKVVLQAPSGPIEIPYAAFGRSLATDAMLDEAMAAGRGGDLVTRLPGEIRQALDGTVIQPRLVFDRAALQRAIVGAIAPLAVAPVDATITMGPDGPSTTPARNGVAVDPALVAVAAVAAVGRLDAPAALSYPVTTAVVPPSVTDEEVAAAAERAKALVGDVRITYKKQKWTIKAATVRSWIRVAATDAGSVSVTVDPALVQKAISKNSKAVKAVYKKPSSAFYLKTKRGKVVGVAPGLDGRQLDVPATATLVIGELANRLVGMAPAPVEVAWAPVEPKVTTKEATAKGVPVLTKLGTWTTWFPISERNHFGANIWIPALTINGTLLKPGQRFEWWSALGPVTPARGYGPGGVIKSDHTDPTGALGGGMCSSSTTLFNAALRAGLQINARSNHKYYITRYPLGLDATVSKIGSSGQTMSFTNDTKNPILIRGVKSRSGGRGFVTYELWGIPDGRTVQLSRPSVFNVIAASTQTEYVTTLPKGVRQQVEYPSNQMDVAVTRIVRNAAGKIIHREVFRTHYVLWNGLIQVGV